MKEKGLLNGTDAVELNGHWLYRTTNAAVARWARKHDMAVVGGSDAHKPKDIGRQSTVFPRMGEAFADLKEAIRRRTTRVKRGKRYTLFDYNHHSPNPNLA